MTPFGLVVVASGSLVVFAGLLIGYTVLTYRDHVLYPSAIGVLGLTLVAAGTGTVVSAPLIPGGNLVTLGLGAIAGVGYCLAGWLISTAVLGTDEPIHIEPIVSDETRGFATDQ